MNGKAYYRTPTQESMQKKWNKLKGNSFQHIDIVYYKNTHAIKHAFCLAIFPSLPFFKMKTENKRLKWICVFVLRMKLHRFSVQLLSLFLLYSWREGQKLTQMVLCCGSWFCLFSCMTYDIHEVFLLLFFINQCNVFYLYSTKLWKQTFNLP